MNPPYEQWQLTSPSLRAPSVLYALHPVGIGTPHVESMTSYIARLAEAHCVFPGVLVRKVIAPTSLKGSSVTLQLGDGRATGAFNSAQQIARNAVTTLESLTMQCGLRSLTMIIWKEVLPLLGLIRPTRAWCPCCLQQWQALAQTIYEPLLWAVQAVKVCEKHHRLLEMHCPGCKRTAPWLAWRSRPGYCPHCQQWLGTSEETEVSDEKEMTWFHWCADQVGALLTIAPTLTMFPARASVDRSLVSLLEQIGQGGKVTLARSAGLPGQLIRDWFSHRHLPGLENLLRVCFVVSISLQDFLTGQPLLCTLRSLGMLSLMGRTPRQNAHGFWKSDQVRQILESIVASEEIPPPSLKAVIRQLGGDCHCLKIYHPGPCQAISERYAAYMRAQKLATEQQRCQEVRDAVRLLIEQKRSPSTRNVALLLSKPGLLRSSAMREVRRAAIREWEESNMENR